MRIDTRPADPQFACAECGKIVRFSDRPSYTSRRHFMKRRYCSLACHTEARKVTIEERFWQDVIRLGDDECWGWRGWTSNGGYGRFMHNNAQHRAHRFSLELHSGKPIPEGMYACHHCDNPPYTNPSHLFVGSPRDNVLDKVAKGRARGRCSEART